MMGQNSIASRKVLRLLKELPGKTYLKSLTTETARWSGKIERGGKGNTNFKTGCSRKTRQEGGS